MIGIFFEAMEGKGLPCWSLFLFPGVDLSLFRMLGEEAVSYDGNPSS